MAQRRPYLNSQRINTCFLFASESNHAHFTHEGSLTDFNQATHVSAFSSKYTIFKTAFVFLVYICKYFHPVVKIRIGTGQTSGQNFI